MKPLPVICQPVAVASTTTGMSMPFRHACDTPGVNSGNTPLLFGTGAATTVKPPVKVAD